jgi:hypothetical protein
MPNSIQYNAKKKMCRVSTKETYNTSLGSSLNRENEDGVSKNLRSTAGGWQTNGISIFINVEC